MDDDYTGIVFCPICCTNHDVEGTGEQTFECNNCGQQWVMTIDPARAAEHSIQ